VADNCATPISNELRGRIVRYWNALADGKKVIAFKLDDRPGEVVSQTAEGVVTVTITEDSTHIYFRMPSGTEDRKVAKERLLAYLAEKETPLVTSHCQQPTART